LPIYPGFHIIRDDKINLEANKSLGSDLVDGKNKKGNEHEYYANYENSEGVSLMAADTPS
jgi:hypothetical protein